MKRERKREADSSQAIDMAKCLMLLPQSLNNSSNSQYSSTNNKNLEFECTTCNRKFPSFQALGGHRASHKRQKTSTDDEKPTSDHKHGVKFNVSGNNSNRVHECSICGQEFMSGQALGGHMRKHRVVVMNEERFIMPTPIRVLKRMNSGRRVMGLDLNLTPLENDLEFLFGKNRAPIVDPRMIV